MEKIEKNTLSNGIKVLGQTYKDSFATSTLVLVRTGSRNETDEINGISHFLEHMNFKGTLRRPTSLDITKELDSMGAEYNAMTDKEYTGYYIKSDKDHFGKGLDILSDMTFSSVLDREELEKEKGTIIEEINMYEDTPTSLVFDLFDEIFFKSKKLSQSVIGSKDIIRSINTEMMKNYRDKHYKARDILVSCAGGLPVDYLEKINKFFSKVSSGGEEYAPTKNDNELHGKRVMMREKKSEQSHMVLGVPGYDVKNPERYAARVLSVILGGTMSSRLFSEIREKRGLAYHISAFATEGYDNGAFRVRAGLNLEKTEEAVKIIVEELEKAKKDITEEELQRAKDYIRGTMALSEEDSMNAASSNGMEELMGGNATTLTERIKKYESLALEDVLKVAGDIIKPDKYKLAIIGPFKDEQKFVKILGN